MAVLVETTATTSRVLERHIIELSDPGVPAARQPYHASTGLAREPDSPELLRLIASIESYARGALASLLDGVSRSERRLRGAGIVVGSDIDPARIGNPHVRAHANEGRLFRNVVANALGERSLPCTIFVERDLFSAATPVLGHSDAALKRLLAELGRPLGGPWRRDDKLATLAAWLVLASPSSTRERR